VENRLSNPVIQVFDKLDSTNLEVLRLARQGSDEGLVIIAREQTAGRGRLGRHWISNPDAGLYMTILLRPDLPAGSFPLITLAAGVAVSETLSEIGIQNDIKWVNDILVNGKKICGILAEITETQKGVAIALGIGINLRRQSLPEEVELLSTSIEEHIGKKISPDSLVSSLLRYFSYFYNILHSEDGHKEIIEAWRRRSSYFSGKKVRLIIDNSQLIGTTEGLEPDGALRLRLEDGLLKIIRAGDVRQLREYG
jgi:BirA family biotin operon repressor/biotin-[acetyl-CoA-carboxylase] ligase